MEPVHIFSVHKRGDRHSLFIRMEALAGDENLTIEEIRELEDVVRGQYPDAEVKYLALAEDAGYMQRNPVRS